MDRKLEQNRIILSPFEPNSNAKLISDNSYVALEAPDGAPEMSPERVKEILSELWPPQLYKIEAANIKIALSHDRTHWKRW